MPQPLERLLPSGGQATKAVDDWEGQGRALGVLTGGESGHLHLTTLSHVKQGWRNVTYAPGYLAHSTRVVGVMFVASPSLAKRRIDGWMLPRALRSWRDGVGRQ